MRIITLKRTKMSINSGLNVKFHELIPIISRCDSFKPWQEDHLNGQIKIWLKLKENEDFPTVWKTYENVKNRTSLRS